MSDAESTRNFEIKNILIGHCGENLTPDKLDEITSEIEAAMKTGPCAWAFRGAGETVIYPLPSSPDDPPFTPA